MKPGQLWDAHFAKLRSCRANQPPTVSNWRLRQLRIWLLGTIPSRRRSSEKTSSSPCCRQRHVQLSTTEHQPILSSHTIMAPLTTAARALRAAAVPRAIRCLSTTAARTDAAGSSYESPFKGERTTTRVPDFSHYASKGSPNKNLMYQYFMVGGLGAITAMGAKSTIQGERVWRSSAECWTKGDFDGSIVVINGRGTCCCCCWGGGGKGNMRKLRVGKQWTGLTKPSGRIPQEHVRISRCFGHGQGRG